MTPATDRSTPAERHGEDGAGKRSATEAYAHAVYGLVSIAVVIAAFEVEEDSPRLPLLLIGYALAIWLAHAYAMVVASGSETTWSEALREERPVALSAVPAVLAATVGGLASWHEDTTGAVALLACLVALVALQVTILRSRGIRPGHVVSTAAVDAIIGGLVVTVLLLVH